MFTSAESIRPARANYETLINMVNFTSRTCFHNVGNLCQCLGMIDMFLLKTVNKKEINQEREIYRGTICKSDAHVQRFIFSNKWKPHKLPLPWTKTLYTGAVFSLQLVTKFIKVVCVVKIAICQPKRMFNVRHRLDSCHMSSTEVYTCIFHHAGSTSSKNTIYRPLCIST